MLATTAIILMFVVFLALISRKLNVPLILIALAIGIFFGSDVTGLIYFDDASLTQRVANGALIFILFAGGFGTKEDHLRPVFEITMLLATGGVLLTAAAALLPFVLITGFEVKTALLLCVIISSTDAAAIFSILRTRSINRRLTSITEIESAANDPMAIISTVFVIQLITGAHVGTLETVTSFLWQLLGGVGLGVLFGLGGVFVFKKIRDIDLGYFYLFLIALIILTHEVANFCQASGMLAVFFAGLTMGNKSFPYKYGISSFTEALSFVANVLLFVLLGLLVFPKDFPAIWMPAVGLFVAITFVGRPVAVLVCTGLAKLSLKDKAFLSWSGIKGAVPIVLATYPAAAGLDPNHHMFNIVFLAVLCSILTQGTTIGRLADALGLAVKGQKKSRQSMELITAHETSYELIEVYIDDDLYQGECRIMDLSLPVGTTITMINRDDVIIAPAGKSRLLPGDILSLLVDIGNVDSAVGEILSKFGKK